MVTKSGWQRQASYAPSFAARSFKSEAATSIGTVGLASPAPGPYSPDLRLRGGLTVRAKRGVELLA
jgi:hypothetical protein